MQPVETLDVMETWAEMNFVLSLAEVAVTMTGFWLGMVAGAV